MVYLTSAISNLCVKLYIKRMLLSIIENFKKK